MTIELEICHGPQKVPTTKEGRRRYYALRGARVRRGLILGSVLTEEQILKWADAHREATGRWPMTTSGRLIGIDGESWSAINQAMREGRRGLSGSTTLHRLLGQHRDTSDPVGKENRAGRLTKWSLPRPPFTYEAILSWVDEYHRLTCGWPLTTSLPKGLPLGTSWYMVNRAMVQGLRGLPGGTSLAVFLQERRGVRSKHCLPSLTIEQILTWADAHYAATGRWPTRLAGDVPDAPPPGETWSVIHSALATGIRGLPYRTSLAKLLAEKRRVRGKLTVERIAAWADAHREATGDWPTPDSGAVIGAYDENWFNIDACLFEGSRGLAPRMSLIRLLAKYRGRVPRSASISWEDRAAKEANSLPMTNQGKDAPAAVTTDVYPARLAV
jgi:hypothetical protein